MTEHTAAQPEYTPERMAVLLDTLKQHPDQNLQSEILAQVTYGGVTQPQQIAALIEEKLKLASGEQAAQLSPSVEVPHHQQVKEAALENLATLEIQAKQYAAQGMNADQISQKIGVGDAVVTNIAQNTVQEHQQHTQRAEQATSKAMHEETVAKVEGREPPVAEANPFAAMVSGVFSKEFTEMNAGAYSQATLTVPRQQGTLEIG